MRVLRVGLILLAIAAAGPSRSEPAAKQAGKAQTHGEVGANEIFAALTRPDHPAEIQALRSLLEVLDGSPDAQRLAAARSQLEQVLQAEERHQTDLPPELVMSGIASRIESAMAELESARRGAAAPLPETLPRFVVPGLAAVSAALAVALIACLAGLAARGRQSEDAEELRETLKKIRRRLEGTGSVASPPGVLAQELAEVASGEASEAVHQAAVAVDRLGAAARDAESRLESSVGAAESRLHAAATMAGQLEHWVEALPARLAETVLAMEARGLEAVEVAALRVENATAPLAEIGYLLADYAGAASGLTAQAEEAALDLQGLVGGLERKMTEIAETLPEFVMTSLKPVLGELGNGADLLGELSNLSIGQAAKLEDIIGRADKVAYDLPAIGQLLEAASAHLLEQMAQDAASAARVNEAAENLAALSGEAKSTTMALPAAAEAFERRVSCGWEALEARAEAGAHVAGDRMDERLAKAAEVLEMRLQAGAKNVIDGVTARLGEAVDNLGTRLSAGADAVQAHLEADAQTVSALLSGRLLQTADAVGERLAGRAELFQAGLEAGAVAVVDAATSLPAIRDGLREVAVHLAREASSNSGTLSQVVKSLATESAILLKSRVRPEDSFAEPQDALGIDHLHALTERVSALTGQLETVLAAAEFARSEREAAESSARAQEADQMASLLDALAGRAEACLSALPAEAASLAATAAQLRGDAAELSAAAARIAEDAMGQVVLPVESPGDVAGEVGVLLTARQSLEENLTLLTEARRALSDEVSAIAHEVQQIRQGSAASQAGFSASAREAEAAIRHAVETLGKAIAGLPAEIRVGMPPSDTGVQEVQGLLEVLCERQAEWIEKVEQIVAGSGSVGVEGMANADGREVAAGIAVQTERLAALLQRVEALAAREPEAAPVLVAGDAMAHEIEARLAAQAERLAGLLERNEVLAERLTEALTVDAKPGDAVQPAAVDNGQAGQAALKGLEAATETVQLAVQRLLESAAAQDTALARATQAASEVARLSVSPGIRGGTDRMGLAGLNGLASLAETLQGEAESLAASVLRGETARFPAELVSHTPVMLAAIETSIHRLRGTATALALASDAHRKAA